MKGVLERVGKKYGRTRALDGVSLSFGEGEIIAVLGLNGAGKTTLLRVLSGLVAPTYGKVFYDGDIFESRSLYLKRKLMFLPDFPLFYPEMTPLRHIGMVLSLYDRSSEGLEDAVVELLSEFDISRLAWTRMDALSRGQVYKAALTAMLALDPELWLLDEPFASGMDPIGLARFKKRALSAARRGGTIVYSTQIVEVNEGFADKLLVLDGGRLVAFGTLDEIRSMAIEGGDPLLSELFVKLASGREEEPDDENA